MAKILADTEIRNKLEEIFQGSSKTVSEAVNCRSDSELANKIRAMAIKMGGSVKREEHVTII